MDDESKSPTDDYATTAIPMHKRKGIIALTATYAGFFASAFNLFVGGAVGDQLNFIGAVVATMIGGAVILAVCIGMAMIAYKRGLTTYMLARSSFGRVGQSVPSLVVVVTQPAFAALYTGTFGVMIHQVWPVVPWWVGGLVFVVCVTATAIYGFKGLAALSIVAVPAIVLLVLYGVAQINPTALFAAEPANPKSFWLVVSFVFGGWIAGATMAGADIGRYAQCKRDVVLGPVIGYVVGFVFIALVSAALALREGTGDIVAILLGLDLTIPALLLYFLLIWTTADNILYYVGLALTNIEDALTDRPRVGKNGWVLMGAVAILALGLLAHSMGFIAYMTSLVNMIGIAVPPFGGILLADYYLLGRLKMPESELNRLTQKMRPNAFVAWAAAIAVGVVCSVKDWGAPSLYSLMTAVILFVVIEKVAPSPAPVMPELVGELDPDPV
jgi:cytosine permease